MNYFDRYYLVQDLMRFSKITDLIIEMKSRVIDFRYGRPLCTMIRFLFRDGTPNHLNAAHVLRNVLSILCRYSPSRPPWRSARKCQQLQRDYAW